MDGLGGPGTLGRMRLLLIRHGQTDSNVQHLLDTAFPGAPLNERGRVQAEDLVEALKDEKIDAIYASTRTRAQETAAPLAEARGLRVEVIDGLEEIAAGNEEMSSDWAKYVDVLSQWSPSNLDVGLEGGETAREFLERYMGALQQIEGAGHENVAAVSHGAALRVIGLTLAPRTDPAIAMPLANTQWLTLEGNSTEGWRLVAWGEHAIPQNA